MVKEKNQKPEPIELEEFMDMLKQDGWYPTETLNFFDVGDLEREHNWETLQDNYEGDPTLLNKIGDEVRWGSHKELGMDEETGRKFCEENGLTKRDYYFRKEDDSISFWNVNIEYETLEFTVLYNDGDGWTPKSIHSGPLYYYSDFVERYQQLKEHLFLRKRKSQIEKEVKKLQEEERLIRQKTN